MSILNYSPPQVLVFQQLDVETSTQVPRLATCVLAPKYLLNRPDKEKTINIPFGDGEQVLDFDYLVGDVATPVTEGLKVDHDFTRLYGKGMRLNLATISAEDELVYLASLEEPNALVLDSGLFKGPGLLSDFHGRTPVIGDRVLLTDSLSGGSRNREVVGFRGSAVPSTKGTNNDRDNNLFSAGIYNPRATEGGIEILSSPSSITGAVLLVPYNHTLTNGSLYLGYYGELLTFTVVTGGAPGTAAFSVTSASGAWDTASVTTQNYSGNYLVEFDEGLVLDFARNGSTVLSPGETIRVVVYGNYNPLDMSEMLTASGTYTGKKNTTYVIQVVTGSSSSFSGALLRIYDTAGEDEVLQNIEVSSGTPFALGSLGLTATFTDPGSFSAAVPQNGLRAGDTYYIHVIASTYSTTEFNTLLLDGPAVDTTTFNNLGTALNATFFIPFSGEIPAKKSSGTVQWESTDSGILLDGGLTLEVPARDEGYRDVPFVVSTGVLRPYWRAVYPLGDLESIDSIAQSLAKAGAYDLDNDAGFAAVTAFEAAEGQRIYFVGTGGTTLEDFSAALEKTTSSDITTFLGIVSTDPEIRLAAKAHCAAQSAPDVKNFRRAYCGIDSPGEYAYATVDGDNQVLTGTISAYGAGNLKLTLDNDYPLSGTTLTTGDIVRLPATSESYVIASIFSESEIILRTGPLSPISPSVPLEFWKGNNKAATKDYLKSGANVLSFRRATLGWQQSGYKKLGGVNRTISNKFLGAWIAGRRSALPPQVGLTRQVCGLFDAMPAMYNTYTPDDLNELAAEGLFIVNQEMAGGPIRVRHQLTTDVSHGSLYYEDNISLIIDWLSFQFKDATEPFIGIKNATPRTLSDLRAIYTDILLAASEEALDSVYGAVIEGFANLVISIDPLARDQFDFSVDIDVPTPLNKVRITLRGRGGIVTSAIVA